MNKIMLTGRLCRDADVLGTVDSPRVTFTLFVTSFLPRGETDTQLFNCVAFNTLATFLARVRPQRGVLVGVEGRMRRRTSTDRNGVEKSDMEVVIDHFEFLEPKRETETQQSVGGGRGAYVEDLTARAPHDIWR